MEEITYRLLEEVHGLKKGTKFRREWNHTLANCCDSLSPEEKTEVARFAQIEGITIGDKEYTRDWTYQRAGRCEVYLDCLYEQGIVEKISRRKK